MARILAVANQKGGVGKTTTSVNLAASVAAQKKRVLLVDLDPQGNASVGSGVNKHTLDRTVSDVLLGNASAREAIVPTDEAGYSLLPANGELTRAEVELPGIDDQEYRLKSALAEVSGDYDFIFIDCPPSLNALTVNALVAADGVVIPMQCEYYALEGLSALMSTIRRIRESANPKLRIAGLLRTMYDPRNNLANDVSKELIQHFGDQVFTAVIPRNVRLAEAPSHGQPVLHYDQASRGALAYLALALELTSRESRISDRTTTARSA